MGRNRVAWKASSRRQAEHLLQALEVSVETVLQSDEEQIVEPRSKRSLAAEPKGVMRVQMADPAHGALGTHPPRGVVRRERSCQLIRCLEERESDALLLAPRVVVPWPILPPSTVECAYEAADWIANQEHELLTDR